MAITDTAIARIQAIALACSGIKAAPTTPVDDAGVLPMAITHITAGSFTEINATDGKLMVNISADFHFDRQILRLTYERIDALIPDFLQRLGGDPTLNGAVSTIVYPVLFQVSPTQWDSITTQMVTFTIPIKFNLLAPVTTP